MQLACGNVGTMNLDHVNARCARGNLCMGTLKRTHKRSMGTWERYMGTLGTFYGNAGTLYGNVCAHCGTGEQEDILWLHGNGVWSRQGSVVCKRDRRGVCGVHSDRPRAH
jgi:hypothetical protein